MSDHEGVDWFDQAPCGLVSTSLDGVIVAANPAFVSWTGYRAEDLCGRSFASLLDPGSLLFFDTRHTQLLHLRGQVEEVALTLRKADGERMPVLINAVRDASAGFDRIAVFNATERVRHERDLLEAKRLAEASERRVRILQDVSTAFDVTATDEDVAQSFAEVAAEAFAAREAAVLLWQPDGSLALMGGSDPLHANDIPVPALWSATEVTVVQARDQQSPFPELASAMRAARLVSLTVTPLIGDGAHLGVLVCFFAARTELDDHDLELQQALGRQASQTLTRVRLQRRLAFLALHDQLTGVGNRQLLQSAIDDAIAESTATGRPLAVMFLDIDDFKSINDAFGHAAGDQVLVALAERLSASLRATDVVGRMGGDEFVALCADTDVAAAEQVAERVLELCREPIVVPSGVISASVSVGIDVYRPGLDGVRNAPQMLMHADAAMYDSKRGGKDRFTLSEPA
ncbi:hypothetical protein GCM10022200_17870 [Microbacterium awajiense]|uniref:Diguanylate cyclase n=1 Tax=Microbacterium awajiense TaxID=415214 RepID=A0ABP7ALW3_9MICO